ncbi:MAG: type II toxin-antitoxin system HicB family antitoxin [Coriobacteriales bacterium]|nr:type II toxin-antitoxin system HicB family antitoxin [Coriobacteriales bacterium]
MLKHMKIVVEQHEDGFVAYPLGVAGAVVGQGETAESALADARAALQFHVQTFGNDAFEDPQLIDAFLVDETVAVE